MSNKGLTAAQITERNATILRWRLLWPTMSIKDIAREFDLSDKAVYKILAQNREEQKKILVDDTTDYLAVVAEKVQAFADLRAQFATAAKNADNSNAKIGALKQIADLHEKEIELLQKTGLLPNDLGIVRVQLNMRVLQDEMLRIFDKYMPKKTFDAAERELIDALSPGLHGHDTRGLLPDANGN